MSADQVSYYGRFKDPQGRYEEIQEALIEGFEESYLEPEDGLDEDIWEELFETKNDYLELYIDNCYGNFERALDFIEKEFIPEYSDVLVEFAVVEMYGDVYESRITYDGEKTLRSPHSKAAYGNFVEDEFEFCLIK